MTHYLLSIYQPDGPRPAPQVLEKIARDCDAFIDEAKAAGVWVFSGGLHLADTSTVVRPRESEALVTDGPYLEGKEHLGGLTIIKAPDLDAALDWGRKLAGATTLPIEVRPFEGVAGD